MSKASAGRPQVWRGPNAGYLEAHRPLSGIDLWPPNGVIKRRLKPIQQKDGIVYNFGEYLQLTAEQIAWEAIAKMLNLDPEEPALAAPQIEKPILCKLITAVSNTIESHRNTNYLASPSPEDVSSIFQPAMMSGNPLAYLDDLMTQQYVARYPEPEGEQ